MNMLRVCKIHTLVSFLRLAEVKGVNGEAGTSSLERVAAVHERTCGEQSGDFSSSINYIQCSEQVLKSSDSFLSSETV